MDNKENEYFVESLTTAPEDPNQSRGLIVAISSQFNQLAV